MQRWDRCIIEAHVIILREVTIREVTVHSMCNCLSCVPLINCAVKKIQWIFMSGPCAFIRLIAFTLFSSSSLIDKNKSNNGSGLFMFQFPRFNKYSV